MLEAVFNLSSRHVEVPLAGRWQVAFSTDDPGYGGQGETRAGRGAHAARSHGRPSATERRVRVWPGSPAPLGATWDGEGTNFAIFSEHATAVDLCLFDRPEDGQESAQDPSARADRPDLARVSAGRASGPALRLPGARTVRAGGGPPVQPGQAAARSLRQGDQRDHPLERRALRIFDDAADGDPGSGRRPVATAPAALPKSVVVESAFSWGDDKAPRTPWNRTVIYESHVKGMTMLHPDVPEALRGTYLGLATDPIVDHLQSLGVTAIELLPVHHFVTERRLDEAGLVNYWGYNTIGFFAPDVRYATGGIGQQVAEFKSMVKRFHRAGIEVILDVVYNHTAEGNHLGPTLSLPRHRQRRRTTGSIPQNRRFYVDYTGTGNTLDIRHSRDPAARDGQPALLGAGDARGRLPLRSGAGARARRRGRQPVRASSSTWCGRTRWSRTVKLIAEPWDLGPGGYQVGRFPIGWGGVERQVPRQHAAVLARRPGAAWGSSPRGSPAAAISSRPASGARRRASTSSPATTGSPCTTW